MGAQALPASTVLSSCRHHSTHRISRESVPPSALSLSLLCSWVSWAAPELCLPNLLSCTGSVWHTQCLRAWHGHGCTAVLCPNTAGRAGVCTALTKKLWEAMGYAWLRPEGPHVLRLVWPLPGTCRSRRCRRRRRSAALVAVPPAVPPSAQNSPLPAASAPAQTHG